MISLADSFKSNRVFLCLWLASMVALTIAICLIDKGTLHLLLCDHHAAWADRMLPMLSDTCHWLPYVITVMLLLWRWQAGAFLGSSLLLSTLLTQSIKHIVCAPRPLTWFAEHRPDISLPLTDGVNMHYYLSFPSGHATTFFSLYFGLSFLFVLYSTMPASANRFWGRLFPNQHPFRAKLFPDQQKTPSPDRKASGIVSTLVQVVCFALAAVSSYSRIYLSQHFALDVLAGMLIGVVSVIIVAVVAQRRFGIQHHS
ncbi:MAG: phosphatase PAP2 family protein [Paludibacteraceae bacterium]|nr:phosphatase PAP2 family protein [Paludibacteraceae bacterium]